jgi:hypothetical protein
MAAQQPRPGRADRADRGDQARHAYLLVDRDDDGKALITTEHPFEMILQHAPGNRRKVVAGLKKWVDVDSGFVFANVYLPEGVHKFKSDRNGRRHAAGRRGAVEAAPGRPAANPSGRRADRGAREQPDDARRRPVRPEEGVAAAGRDQQARDGHDRGVRVRGLPAAVGDRRRDPRRPGDGQPLDREKWLSAVSRMWAVEDETRSSASSTSPT